MGIRLFLCALLVTPLTCITAAPVPEKKEAPALEKTQSGQVQPKLKKQAKDKPVIYQFDNAAHQNVLNTPTEVIKKLPDKELDAFIKTMHSAMTSNIGGGISANQLGKPWQVFLIGPPPMVTASAPSEVFINPVITKASKERVCFWHGCLSTKGKKFGKVATWKNITMAALDAKGNKFSRDLVGLDAIVAQHEFRHLLGGGYHDHAREFQEEKELFMLMLQKKEKLVEVCDEKEPFLLDDYKVGEKIEDYGLRKKQTKLNEQKKKSGKAKGKASTATKSENKGAKKAPGNESGANKR